MKRAAKGFGASLLALMCGTGTASASPKCFITEHSLVALSSDGRFAEYLDTDSFDSFRVFSLVDTATGREVRRLNCEATPAAPVCAEAPVTEAFQDAPELTQPLWSVGNELDPFLLRDRASNKARPVRVDFLEDAQVRVHCPVGKPRELHLPSLLPAWANPENARLVGAARVGDRVLLAVAWGSYDCDAVHGTEVISACQ